MNKKKRGKKWGLPVYFLFWFKVADYRPGVREKLYDIEYYAGLVAALMIALIISLT